MLLISDVPAQRDVFTLVIAIIGASTGVVGAVLGVFNSAMSWRRDRPQLRIVPQLYFEEKTKNRYVLIDRPHKDFVKSTQSMIEKLKLAIEVINSSSDKALTITHVGFARRFAEGRLLLGMEGVAAVVPDGAVFGRRIEPLTRLIIYTHYTPRMLFEKYGLFTFAFAETESGKMFRGSSRILHHIRKELSKRPWKRK
jgi:hypothetical protein